MDLVVSDSSTLIHLAAIQRLELLQQFFQNGWIPSSVWREVVEQGTNRAGAREVANARQAGWIDVAAPTNVILLHVLTRELDQGEAEVIALALEKQATLVLIDEVEGRRVAEVHGLAKTGVIGLLIRAKQEGLISSLKIEIERLQNLGNFWIEAQFYHSVLTAVGEE